MVKEWVRGPIIPPDLGKRAETAIRRRNGRCDRSTGVVFGRIGDRVTGDLPQPREILGMQARFGRHRFHAQLDLALQRRNIISTAGRTDMVDEHAQHPYQGGHHLGLTDRRLPNLVEGVRYVFLVG